MENRGPFSENSQDCIFVADEVSKIIDIVMDGNMNIEAQAGKGTKVILEVPLHGG